MKTSISTNEVALANIWQQLLGQQPNPDSHFFAMGGNSLLLIRLSIGLSERVGFSVDVSGLLQNPKFSDMIKHIEQKAGAKSPQYDDSHCFNGLSVPLSFAQRAVWQAIQNGAGSMNHNMPFSLHILNQLNLDRFKTAMAHLMMRHQIFRAQVEMNAQSQPMMTLNGEPLTLNILDLSGSLKADKAKCLTDLEYDLFNTPIQVFNAPLAILQLVKLSEDEYYFYFNIHHIVFDGVSCELFIKELMDLYSGKSLPALSVDYFDYIQWESSPSYRDALQPGLSYWQQKLAGYKPLILPFSDHQSQDESGELMVRQLSVRHVQALRILAQTHRTTLFGIFTLALQIMLERHKVAGDTVFGAYTAQRVYSEFAQTLGNFINPMMVLKSWQNDQSFAQALATHQEKMAQDFAWQHIPHETIMDALAANTGLETGSALSVSLVFNEQVLQKEHRQGDLHLKLESCADHKIDFAFSTDIEFMVHTDAEGLVVSAAYKLNKVGTPFMQMLLDELLALLIRFSDIDPTIVMAQVMHGEETP
ncbi:condensation domain-containing protein [Neisseriaceae bacterium CLB008]